MIRTSVFGGLYRGALFRETAFYGSSYDSLKKATLREPANRQGYIGFRVVSGLEFRDYPNNAE